MVSIARFALIGCCSFSIGTVHAQAFEINNGQVNTCIGAFLDSGGEGASGYSNNEDYTYTICPDNPGDAISVNFITAQFSLAGAAPVDNMTVYDGNSTSAPVIGNYTGNTLQGQVMSASSNNTSGCLTFVWHSNNNGLGIFAASITCYVPCDRPVAAAVMGEAAPARICEGESVTFNGSASVAAPGFSIASYTWVWGDGTSITTSGPNAAHTFANEGGYVVQLYVTDDNGCSSVNLVDLEVLVGTRPDFDGTAGTLTGCVGEPICLHGQVNADTWSELPDVNLGGGVFLPDNVGECFSSSITFTQFAPGQTITSANDLLSICISIEHSFIGDLIISLIAPTGESVIMHQQGGGSTFLGVPVDNDATPNQQGTCYTYCWSPTATNGTWVDNAAFTLPSGTYESLNPFSGLIGAQLNGTWTIQICDMWASDNGFLCDWGINFDPSLYDDLITFTPVYGAGCDSTWWTGPNITSTANACENICTTSAVPGSFSYVYHAIDNFGCDYDTTLTITVTPGPVVNAGPDVSVCAGGGTQLSATTSGSPLVYSWTPTTGLSNPNIANPVATPGSTITYTVSGYQPGHPTCVGTDQVTVTVNLPPDAGGDGSTTVCADGAAVDLFALLGGSPDAGGAWTAPGGAAATSTYTPGTSAPGTYTYTVTALAPCPNDQATVTVTQNNPVDAGTDGSTTVCTDGAAVDLFALLGGPDPGGAWTAPGGGATTSTYTPGTSAPGAYTYTVTALAPCPNDQATVTVTQNTPVDAGTDGATTVCATDEAIDLFALLGGGPDPGGTWTAPGGGATTNTYTPGTSAPGAYTYTVTALAPCPNDQATVTVTQNNPVDAGTDGSTTVCADGAAVDLFALLGGPDAGGTWTAPGGGAATSTYTPGISTPGVYTYTVSALAPCLNDQATVTVTQNNPVDAGTDGATTVCADGAAVDLFALLGGPDPGGAWTAPGGAAATSTYTPGTSAPGAYTYTVTAIAPCANDQATVTVTQNNPVDAGTDGATTVCADGATVDLFTLLGGPDPGGAWTAPGGGAATSTYTPGTSAPGAYTFTVTALAPCANDQATVTVTQNNPVDAGTDGATTVCADGAAVDLFALLGGPDPGGAWTAPGGGAATSTYTPGTSAPGAYTYTVTALAPCPNDQATVTVTQNNPVDAGTDGATTVCADGAAVDLFALIGGPDPGGAWTAPGGGAATNTYTPGTSAPGAYTYTVTALAPCPNDQATVTVTQNNPVDAGTDGATTVCADGAAVDLFSLLGGPDPGGAWTAPGGGSTTNTYTPGTSAPGAYTYTVTALAPCANDQATVTITQNNPVDAGTDGATTVCADGAAVDLFALLGGSPDAGGAWTAPGGAAATSTYAPGTSAPGAYTYTVTALAPCANDLATVTVTQNTPVDAGVDGALTLCISSPVTNLFPQLGGSPDAGGVWTAPGGGASNGTFTPGVNAVGVYTYTLSGTAPCADASATVTVAVVSLPDPGTDGNITLCTSGAPQDLFAVLGGTPDAGGSWTAPGGGAHSGTVDPAVDPAGVYTYTITVPPPCTSVSSTVTVALQAPPDPGTDGSTLLCVTSPSANLFTSLQGSPDAGGAWTAPGGGAFNGTFVPGTSTAGVYTYTVAGTAPCPNASATVDVAVTSIPDPGNNGNITLCTSGAPQDLFTILGGTPDVGGSWAAPGGGAHSGTVDPAIDPAGIYTYTITVPPPCASVSSTVTLTLQAPPDPGTDGSVLLCVTSPSVNLFNSLQGSPDAGGAWTAPGGGPFNGTFIPGTSAAGIYTYTVAGTAPCPGASATVNVAVTSIPDAGVDGNITLCTSGVPQDLFTLLGGTPDAGGTWTTPGGGAGSGTVDPATDPAGIYTYTIAAPAPCPSVSSTVTVALQTPPDPGADGSTLLCVTSPLADLFGSLQGSPDVGGTWTDPGGSAFNGSFIPGTSAPGVYTYTVIGTSPCPDASAQVDVQVSTLPDPGSNGQLMLCASDQPTGLFTSLGGTPDIGGTWTAPGGAAHSGTFDPVSDAPGAYTYTIAVPPPCVSVSATVQVSVQQPPDPGADGALSLCISGSGTVLFNALTGTPDAGGTWTDAGGNPFPGLFIPGTSVAGSYTYTVLGNAPCPSASASVDVAVNSEPDAGINGAIVLCAGGAMEDLFGNIGGSPDVGGTWTAPDGSPHSGLFDPASDAEGVYTYTITVPPPCSSASSTVTVLLQIGPDPGSNGALTLCATDGPSALVMALGGTPDPNGTWTDPNGNAFTGTFDPETDATGIYTYSLNGIAPCPAASSEVAVDVNMPPDAGANGSLTLCAIDAATALIGVLGGSPDVNGTWTAPGGAAFAGTFDPAVDMAGTYTYTVSGAAPCPSDAATVSIAVETPPSAGSDGNLSLCTSGTAVDLLSALIGQVDGGGTWTAPGGASVGSTLDPATDVAGAYTYTVQGIAPCPAASAEVVVSITAAPNAGADGAILLCNASPAIDLFEHLNGTPSAGGSWTAPGSAPSDGTFDPATGTPGLYTYTVLGTSPCPDASATVLVNVSSNPDAGSPGDITLCASDAPVELLDLLGGTPDAGGAWTAPDGSPHTGTLDPASDAPGQYTYLIAVPPPCVSANSSVTISLVAPADPGLDGALTLCSTNAAQDLFALLGGTPDPNGAWSLNGQAHGSSFDPALDTPGAYAYTVASNAPCPSVSAEVVVQVNVPPDPGTDGAALLCISSAPEDLLTFLGGTPDPGGTWSLSGAAHSSMIDPGVDISGDYMYTVDGAAPCVSASALVTVTIATVPDPGEDGSRTLCQSDTPIDLFTELSGTPDVGGTWSGPGTVVDGQFDPGTMNAGVYTYLIDVPPPCTSVSSTVTITTVQPPDPGTAGTELLCVSSPAVNLFDALGGTPAAGGSWTDPAGLAHGPLFNPAADPSGDYTYLVNGMVPCPSAQAIVSVNVVMNPDPGGNGALSLCQSDDVADLFERLEGSPDVGGTWSGPSASPDGLFDPGTMLAGEYTYLLDAPQPCLDASSTVLVTVATPPDAGDDGAGILCLTSDAVDLFALLQGTPGLSGTWTTPGGAPHSNVFDPAQDPGGDYTYTVQGDVPCPADAAVVSMTVHQPPDAGTDGSITLCPEGSAIDLFAQLGGNPDVNGAWTGPGGTPNNGSMDPSIDPEGTYTYLLAGAPPCANDASVVVVDVSDPILASTVVTDAICHGACDGKAALTILGGTPDFTMQWSGNVAGGDALTAENLCAGSYTINITDANGCTGTTTYVISEPPPLVIDAIGVGDENCIGSCDGYLNIVDGQGVLFSIDGGDTWSSNNVIGDLCAGGYLVTMQDANGCLASAPAQILSPPPVVAEFYAAPDTMSVSGTLVEFTNQSGNAETFVWDFAGLGSSTEGNPSFAFPDVLGGIYTICLTAISSNGCQDSVCHPIVVLDELYVNVPNAFTPDRDGINEGFCPIFNNPTLADEYAFMIFDRWGLLIFNSETVGEEWDGTLNSVVVQEDVYVWKMHCRDIITGEEYDEVGHVTVVR